MSYKDKEKKYAYSKEWKKKNPEKVKAQKKRWREKNWRKILRYTRKYCQENKDKIKIRNKKWREQNPDYYKKYYKIYQENNKDYLKEYHKKYNKKYQRKNREIINEKEKGYLKQKRNIDKNYAIKYRLKSVLNCALKRYTKTGKIYFSKKYGIDYKAVIEHLKPFPKDLKNYEIHHIKPLHTFNFVYKDGSTNLKEVSKAFSPENHKWLTIKEHKEIHKKNERN